MGQMSADDMADPRKAAIAAQQAQLGRTYSGSGMTKMMSPDAFSEALKRKELGAAYRPPAKVATPVPQWRQDAINEGNALQAARDAGTSGPRARPAQQPVLPPSNNGNSNGSRPVANTMPVGVPQPMPALKAYAKGGKISLDHCSVSTTPKGKKNTHW